MALNNTLYQIENLVIGLLEALNDKQNEVQESISSSLVELGKKRTDFMLAACRSFMIKNGPKLIESQRVYILNTIQKIIKEKIENLEEPTAIGLIELSSSEMTQQKEPSINVQTAASNLLVAIGVKYVKQVFSELLKQFNPGVLPHLFVLNTMANLAEVNPYGVVPQLSGVLASMLPMLGMAKLDSYKYAFASALSKFSEAILYYCSNKDKAPDQSIEKSTFSTQLYAAHEILFNVWIKTSENKLRQTIIEAIGYFVNIIEVDKLEADLSKIIPGILSLYKKHPEGHIVSQAICMIITAINAAKIHSIEVLLDMLLKEMFIQILATVNDGNANVNPNLTKNQNELLRCFTALSIRFCDKILPFLLQKMEQNNEKSRIGSLVVIRHLINSSKEQMANKRELVLSGLRPLLTESNNKVKRYLIQTIVAMGHHGYLHLEGGNLMLEFILKQCALIDEVEMGNKKQTKEHVDQSDTIEQLRATSENVLTLFSTTVDNMQEALWPQLFEYLTHVDYTRALNQLCKNLAYIAEKKRTTSAPDYYVNFNDLINLPKPYEIFSRLFVISGVPLSGKNRGLNALNLLKNISPLLNSGIVSLWDSVIPKLILNLEDHISKNSFEHKKWEDLLMKMLSKTLEEIRDEKEICEYGNAFGKQIGTLISNLQEEKHFSYKCLGIISSKTENKLFIDKHLNIIFNSVNHASQLERDGCAIAFGYASSIHLDSVLQKLETFFKNETKKSGSLFSSILKDTKATEPDQLKATLVLCYGYVTLYASQELIISRLEANILRSVTNFSTNVKDLVLKQNILKSMEIITKCMHVDHLGKEFNFSYKSNLLELMINFIGNENSKVLLNDVKAMCFKVCSNIVKLNPKPSEAEIFTLIKSVTDSFYPLLLPDDKAKDGGKDAKPQAPVEVDPNLLHGSALYEKTATALDTLLADILDRDMNSTGLQNVYKHLEPWLTSINDHERERAMRSFAHLLKHFAVNFKYNPNDSLTQSFHCFGNILGRLVCRSTDPVLKIRQCVTVALNSMLSVLCVYQKYEGEKLKEEQEQLKAIQVCGDKLLKNDPNLLLNAVNELSKVLCIRIPNDQIVQFIEKLVEGLLDLQTHCSVAACLVLKHCVKIRGSELENQVDTLIRHLYSKLNQIQNQQTKQGTLRTIRTIFQLHLVESLNVVLTFPIPCSKDMIDICQSLTEDSKLVSDIIEHIMQIWSRCLPYEDKNNVKFATMTPLIGTCLLTELFSNNTTPETETVFKKNFEKIFSALLLRLASTLNNQMPVPKAKEEGIETKQDAKSAKAAINTEYKKLEPIKISIDCFKSFIKCTQSYELQEYFDKENLWDLLLEESTSVDACTVMAKGICLHGTNYLVNIVNNLMSYLCAPYDCQKINVTAFFAELLNNKCIVDLTELLLNNLLSKLIDPCTPVRTLCIKGLGNISSLGTEQVQKHSTTILSAMMAGLDDKDDLNDDITLESMNGLSKIIALIDENNVRPILINILLRIRPCFEKDKPSIRSSAYILFGKLSRFGRGPSKEPFIEQIHSNFVSFILHLNENDQNVRKSCKFALRQVGPLLNSESVNELFQKALIDEMQLHYGEFINNLSKVLINDFPEKVSFYIMNSVSNFKSQWPEIRSNAVLFSGYLLGNLSRDKQSVLSKEHITNALIKLLKEDPSPIVRCKAADAMSLLHDF